MNSVLVVSQVKSGVCVPAGGSDPAVGALKAIRAQTAASSWRSYAITQDIHRTLERWTRQLAKQGLPHHYLRWKEVEKRCPLIPPNRRLASTSFRWDN